MKLNFKVQFYPSIQNREMKGQNFGEALTRCKYVNKGSFSLNDMKNFVHCSSKDCKDVGGITYLKTSYDVGKHFSYS